MVAHHCAFVEITVSPRVGFPECETRNEFGSGRWLRVHHVRPRNTTELVARLPTRCRPTSAESSGRVPNVPQNATAMDYVRSPPTLYVGLSFVDGLPVVFPPRRLAMITRTIKDVTRTSSSHTVFWLVVMEVSASALAAALRRGIACEKKSPQFTLKE